MRKAADPPRSSLTLGLGLLGGLLCYLAQPPVSLGLLAWVATLPWLLLIRLPRLPGRRPYGALWLAGALHWLATIQWLRLPHPANHFALLFVASYLGLYLPVFVGLSRVAIGRAGVTLWLAAPVVWTGLEWLRARLLTGFLMASLAHTQIDYPPVIQIADVLGEYGVTFLIVLVSACLASVVPLRWVTREPLAKRPPGSRLLPLIRLAPAAAALTVSLGYGYWRLPQYGPSDESPPLRVALVQSDMLADWKGSPERDAAIMRQQLDLSYQAMRKSERPIDLIVWPETMFRHRLHTLHEGYEPPAGLFEPTNDEFLAATPEFLTTMARDLDAALLVGVDRTHWRQPPPDHPPSADGDPPFAYDSYNSSVLVDRTGRVVGTYDKMHLLPFGEYIPLSGWSSLFGSITPITGSATPGELPRPLQFDGHPVGVSICYETVLPHLIRRQVKHAYDQSGTAPDLLVNITNDAWYWGSSELDMHLACAALRAVETRTPMVIAANRGLSAHIDARGRVKQVSGRDRAEVLLCDVQPANHPAGDPTLFVAGGDWFALACLVCCMVFAAIGWRASRPVAPAPAAEFADAEH